MMSCKLLARVSGVAVTKDIKFFPGSGFFFVGYGRAAFCILGGPVPHFRAFGTVRATKHDTFSCQFVEDISPAAEATE
jgi:hypothetical protein